MSVTLILETKFEFQAEEEIIKKDKFELPITLELKCPKCNRGRPDVGEWSFYQTQKGPVSRFMCYHCKITFNAAKIPDAQKIVKNFVWLLAELTIEQGMPISSLSEQWGIPESTLRQLKISIERQLVEIWNQVKDQKGLFTAEQKEQTKKKSFVVFFYDEGFLKISGATVYLLFVIDNQGNPISINLTTSRKADDIQPLFKEAFELYDGYSIFVVTDAARAIHAALLRLRIPVIHVQQVHSGTGKQVLIHNIQPQEEKKGIKVLTIEIHGNTLKLDQESIGKYKERIVYPSKVKPPSGQKKRTKIRSKSQRSVY